MPLTHTPLPITADDAELRAAVADSELPALLVTLAHVTGDLSILTPDLRPPFTPSPGAVPAQGGMSPEQQARARNVAFEALCRFRDQGSRLAGDPSQENLATLMHFITGEEAAKYLPLLAHELNLPVDVGAPAWRKSELAPDRKFSVGIIGAGMSGLAAAYRLRQAGVDFTVFEKNDEVGGTWYENRYPGCRLDTNNFAYSYSFAQKDDWTHQYSERDDIFSYFKDVADEFDLRSSIHFRTEVEAAHFDTPSQSWDVRTKAADGTVQTHRFNAIVSAVGQLNRPSIPPIQGRETFAGEAWHTAQWNCRVDLTGKRVAVIGTGASAFQVIPSIAERVGELLVFQRNAPWMYPTPNYHDEVTSGFSWLLEVLPYYHRWFRFFQFWTSVEGRRQFVTVDPSWTASGSVSEKNEMMREALTTYLKEQFSDRPDLIEKVIPNYPPGAKRLLRDNGVWAEALKRPTTSLITDGISKITPRGIVTDDGVEHPVDIIIYGTGFAASEFLAPMDIRGVDGTDLRTVWNGDARAHRGITIPGFPNLFCLYGPNTNLVVNGSIVLFSEFAVHYTLECIRMLLERDESAIAPRQEAFDDYNRGVDDANQLMAWGASNVSSWYKNSSGRVTQNWPYPLLDYWTMTRAVDADEYEFSGSSSILAGPSSQATEG